MKWLRSQFRTFEAMFVWWRDNLTTGGKALTIGLLLCSPGLPSLNSPLFLLFSAQLSLLITAGLFSHWFRPRLSLRVAAPADVPCGEPFTLVVHVTNRSSRPVCDLELELIDAPSDWLLEEPRRWVGQLSAARSMEFRVAVQARRRGLYELPNVRATSTFPLNLIRLWRTQATLGELLVLPAYHSLAALDLSRFASPSAGEMPHAATALGHGGDYFGSRDYVPGMPVRSWDYSSWARLGRPVVRQFTAPQQPTAAMFVDLRVGHDAATCQAEVIPEFEAMMSLAAALSEALASEGRSIELLAVGDASHDLTDSGVNDPHAVVMRCLATAQPAPQGSGAEILLQLPETQCLPEAAFILLNGWGSNRRALCEQLELRGLQPTRIFLDARARPQAPPRSTDIVLSPAEIESGCVEIY